MRTGSHTRRVTITPRGLQRQVKTCGSLVIPIHSTSLIPLQPARDTHKPLEATNPGYKPEVTMGYNPETTKQAHADALAWFREKILK